jgi:hypothetical protein
MTKDVIALTKQLPDPRSIAAALLSGGPDLRLRTLGEGAVVQLTDDEARPLVSIESPMLLAVPHEAQRLLGVRAEQLGESVWWTEVRARLPRTGRGGLRRWWPGVWWPCWAVCCGRGRPRGRGSVSWTPVALRSLLRPILNSLRWMS